MNVLITGASTGIGEACARWLDGKGHRVFAGVRRDEDGARLRAGSSERLAIVRLDVTDAAAIETARSEVERSVGPSGLHGLVNNAGIAVPGPLEYLSIDAFRRQLEVNVTGQLAVTQAFLPLLRLARGRIVFMGSVSGRMAVPFLGPYSASKYALEAIADALRVELQPWGMHVVIVEPGSIATPIWTKSGRDDSLVPAERRTAAERHYGSAIEAVRATAAATGGRGLPANTVARAVEDALTRCVPRTRYVIGRDARIQVAISRLFPDRLRDRLIAGAMKLPAAGSADPRS